MQCFGGITHCVSYESIQHYYQTNVKCYTPNESLSIQEHTTQGYDQSSLLTVTIFWYGELKWIIKEVERIHSFTSLKRKGGTWEEKEGNWGEKERIEDISKDSRHLYLYSHCLYFYTCWIEGNRMELGWNIHRREHLQGRHKWLI